MTTRSERRQIRNVVQEHLVWDPGAVLDALTEPMAPAEAERWCRTMRSALDLRLDDLRQELARQRPGAGPLDCNQCGRRFYAGSRARFCSSVCRERAYRERRASALAVVTSSPAVDRSVTAPTTGAEMMAARLSQGIRDLQAGRITTAELNRISAEAGREQADVRTALHAARTARGVAKA
jgi:hypothetical protein